MKRPNDFINPSLFPKERRKALGCKPCGGGNVQTLEPYCGTCGHLQFDHKTPPYPGGPTVFWTSVPCWCGCKEKL